MFVIQKKKKHYGKISSSAKLANSLAIDFGTVSENVPPPFTSRLPFFPPGGGWRCNYHDASPLQCKIPFSAFCHYGGSVADLKIRELPSFTACTWRVLFLTLSLSGLLLLTKSQGTSFYQSEVRTLHKVIAKTLCHTSVL